MSTEAPSPLLPQAVPFLDIRQAGPSTIFTYANSKESWAIVTHSAELGVDVLDAPSLGLLQIPLSTYLDDMTSLFPGRCVYFHFRRAPSRALSESQNCSLKNSPVSMLVLCIFSLCV